MARKKCLHWALSSSTAPQAIARGQNPGTEPAIAFRDSYSPQNISLAAWPSAEVFTKYRRSSSVPFSVGTWARIAPVLVKPDPRPEVERVTFDGSDERDSALRMAGGTGDMVDFTNFKR